MFRSSPSAVEECIVTEKKKKNTSYRCMENKNLNYHLKAMNWKKNHVVGSCGGEEHTGLWDSRWAKTGS